MVVAVPKDQANRPRNFDSCADGSILSNSFAFNEPDVLTRTRGGELLAQPTLGDRFSVRVPDIPARTADNMVFPGMYDYPCAGLDLRYSESHCTEVLRDGLQLATIHGELGRFVFNSVGLSRDALMDSTFLPRNCRNMVSTTLTEGARGVFGNSRGLNMHLSDAELVFHTPFAVEFVYDDVVFHEAIVLSVTGSNDAIIFEKTGAEGFPFNVGYLNAIEHYQFSAIKPRPKNAQPTRRFHGKIREFQEGSGWQFIADSIIERACEKSSPRF